METAAAEIRDLRGGITGALDETIRLAAVTTFEDDEAGARDGMSANTMETLINRTQGVFLTATLLANEAGLAERQRLPELAQRAESQLRGAVTAELDRTAALLTDGKLGEPIDLETAFAAWDRAASRPVPEVSQDGRVTLVRRLATQARQFTRQLQPG